MNRAFIAIFLIFCAGAAFADPALTLTLPDNGSYSYWIQSRNGSISALPANVSHQTSVTVRAPLEKGDHLVLLDASTGQWAEQTVTLGADGKPAPVAFAMGDFHSLAAPAPAAAVQPSNAEDAGTGGSRLVTTFVSLLLAVALGWFGWYVYQFVRGKPRSAPVELERDPGMILMPVRHRAAGVPTNADRSVVDAELQRGPEIPMAQPATLIGVQGLATGSTFALTVGDVTIGRDGENGIVLAENTVSRYHARLLRQDNGQFALTDLGSANGVYVNGTRVQRAILRSGDQIKVGDNFFQFQMNDESH